MHEECVRNVSKIMGSASEFPVVFRGLRMDYFTCDRRLPVAFWSSIQES